MDDDVNAVQLWQIVSLLRSKNAGPFQITMDIMFDSVDAFDEFVTSDVLTTDTVATLYKVDPSDVRIYNHRTARAVKITIPRPTSSGGPSDTDLFGCQFHSPLAELVVPTGGSEARMLTDRPD